MDVYEVPRQIYQCVKLQARCSEYRIQNKFGSSRIDQLQITRIDYYESSNLKVKVRDSIERGKNFFQGPSDLRSQAFQRAVNVRLRPF